MAKKQVTVKVETFLTIEIDAGDTPVDEAIADLITEMDYSFTANTYTPGTIIETEITDHEISSTTDIS